MRLHGIPNSIISNHDKVFLSRFWKEVFTKSGTNLKMLSAYHPESDGQTKIVNKTIEQYLRATITDNPKDWVELLRGLSYGITPLSTVAWGRHHSKLSIADLRRIFTTKKTCK